MCACVCARARALQKIIFFDFVLLGENIFDIGFEWVQPGSGVKAWLWVLGVLLGMRGDVRVSFMHSGRGRVGHTLVTFRVRINPVELPGTSRAVLAGMHNDSAFRFTRSRFFLIWSIKAYTHWTSLLPLGFCNYRTFLNDALMRKYINGNINIGAFCLSMRAIRHLRQIGFLS